MEIEFYPLNGLLCYSLPLGIFDIGLDGRPDGVSCGKTSRFEAYLSQLRAAYRR